MIKRWCFVALILFFISCVATAAELSHPNKAEAARLDEASCADGFSFAVMADSHTGDVFADITTLVGAMRPDFAVSVGDITDNGLDSEYALFLDRINAAGVPWFAAPGNHEYRSPEGHTSPDGPKRFKKIFGKQDFVFDHCGWRFILIDVVALDMLLPGQIAWLERALKGHEGRAAVFMHYPPAIIEGWEEGYWKSNGEAFLGLLKKFNVRYFFAGHIHIYDRLERDGTVFIVTGGSGGGLDSDRPADKLHTPDGGAFHHFIYVIVNNGNTAIEAVVRPITGR